MKRFGYLVPVMILGFIVFFVVLSSDIATYKNHATYATPFISGEQQFLTEVTIRTGPVSEGWIIEVLNHAHKKAWIGVYTFTLPNMREALLRAQKRGVDVRVILEKNPYGSTNINRETRLFFQENRIPFHESDHTQFAFMHAKYAVIDSDWIVETANWTRSSFAANREFFMVGDDGLIRRSLEDIFEKDFAGARGQSTDMRLLAGPINARQRLTDFAKQSKKSVSLYAPSLSDEEFIESLKYLCKNGRSVRVILAQYDDEKKDSHEEYGGCMQIRFLKKPLHAKAILIDREKAFIGSFNFTKNSLENNREIGIFLSGDAINDIFQTFESDWRQSEVALQ